MMSSQFSRASPGAAVGHGVRVCAAGRGGAANEEKETKYAFLGADALLISAAARLLLHIFQLRKWPTATTICLSILFCTICCTQLDTL